MCNIVVIWCLFDFASLVSVVPCCYTSWCSRKSKMWIFSWKPCLDVFGGFGSHWLHFSLCEFSPCRLKPSQKMSAAVCQLCSLWGQLVLFHLMRVACVSSSTVLGRLCLNKRWLERHEKPRGPAELQHVSWPSLWCFVSASPVDGFFHVRKPLRCGEPTLEEAGPSPEKSSWGVSFWKRKNLFGTRKRQQILPATSMKPQPQSCHEAIYKAITNWQYAFKLFFLCKRPRVSQWFWVMCFCWSYKGVHEGNWLGNHHWRFG